MPDPIVTMLLTAREPTFKKDDLAAELRTCFPRFEGAISVDPPNGAFLVRLNTLLIAVLSMEAPTPAGTLQNAVKNNPSWPSAATELDAHRAHLIVASLSKATDLAGQLEMAAAVTWVSAALVKLTACIGVYWTRNEMVYPANVFICFSDQGHDNV